MYVPYYGIVHQCSADHVSRARKAAGANALHLQRRLGRMMSDDRPVALIADEQELFRAGLSAVLKRDLGFGHVIEAGSLEEALTHLKQPNVIILASFELALLGIKTAAQLQAVREACPGVRMAVVSASSRRDDILQALAAGAHGFIPKTLPIAETARAFRLVLEGHIYVPPCLAEVPPGFVAPSAALAAARTSGLEFDALTLRQQDVLDLMRQGKSNKQIARSLSLAVGTIKVHVNALFRTLDVHNRVDAITAVPPSGVNGQHGPAP